jgi:hypothetical protein
MRPSKLALFLVCCAACDGAELHLDGGSPGEQHDGGSKDAGEDASADAAADAAANATTDWGLLEAEEIATPEAAEQIMTLECSELDLQPCGG